MASSQKVTTLTEFLTAAHGVIYDEHQPKVVRMEGKPSVLKRSAIDRVMKRKPSSGEPSDAKPLDYEQAERLVEQRLLHLIQLGRVSVSSE